MHTAAQLPDRAALATLRRETGLETILVQTADLDIDARLPWEEIAARGRDDLVLIARDGGDLLFRVTPGADTTERGEHPPRTSRGHDRFAGIGRSD
jgi:hypothetical protein